ISHIRNGNVERVRVLLPVAAIVATAATAAWVVRHDHDASSVVRPSTRGAGAPRGHVAAKTRPRVVRIRMLERPSGRLAAPVQDAAAAPLGAGNIGLFGGLTAADTSRADIRITTASSDRGAGMLPQGLHDTAAVRLGHAVYLFGGGNGVSQSE